MYTCGRDVPSAEGEEARDGCLGNYVEFGANVCVVGDIDVGNNVKIGAGAVVTKSVPDNSVVVGVPARVIKTLEPLPESVYSIQ